MLNICVALKNAGRFAECLELVEQGLKSALANNEFRNYIIYFRLQVWCLMKLGREDEGKELYKKFIMLTYVMDGYTSLDFKSTKTEYESTFGRRLDLSVDW